MRAFRLLIGNCYLFGTVLGLGILSAGCGEEKKANTMIVPDKPVAESQKDSMDAYKADMLKAKSKKKH